MSQVLEVSEGYVADRPVFQPPMQSEDASQPRYITFLGNLMEPQAQVERPWTKGGGIEMASPCLRVVRNFIRKGRLTPVLKDVHDWQQIDKVRKIVDGDPLQHGYFMQTIPRNYTPPMMPAPRGSGVGMMPSPTGNLVAKLAYPGDQINWLTGEGQHNLTGMPFGVVELTELKGHEYKPERMGPFDVDPFLWEIQRAIFPDYPKMPVLFSDVERLLDEAQIHTDLRNMLTQMGNSLRMTVDYATISIQNTHAIMKESAGKGGYVPRYTAMDLVLIEQLGIGRQDREIYQTAREAPASTGRLEEVLAAFIESQKLEGEARAERERALASLLSSNTMAAAPIKEEVSSPQPEVQNPEPQVFACTLGCGKTYPTDRGREQHEKYHCSLRDTSENVAS